MNRNRQKLQAASLLVEYENALKAGSLDRLPAILVRAQFSALEIDSIMWAKGHLGPEEPEETKSDRIIGVIGQTLISAVVAGAITAYSFGGFSGSFSNSAIQRSAASERVMRDYRTPYEAVYRPFCFGFCAGAFLPHVYRLLSRKRR